MLVFSEEKHLLAGEPSPPPTIVEPHWGTPGHGIDYKTDTATPSSADVANRTADGIGDQATVRRSDAAQPVRRRLTVGLDGGYRVKHMQARGRHASRHHTRYPRDPIRPLLFRDGGGGRRDGRGTWTDRRSQEAGVRDLISTKVWGRAGQEGGVHSNKRKKAQANLGAVEKEREEVAADEKVAEEERKALYQAMIRAKEAKEAAKLADAARQEALAQAKERAKARTAAKLQAETDNYLTRATLARSDASAARARAAQASKAIKQATEHEAAVRRYNLAHRGKVNVQAKFNVDSPTGAHIPQAFRSYLEAQKASGADRGAIKFGLHVNVDHPEELGMLGDGKGKLARPAGRDAKIMGGEDGRAMHVAGRATQGDAADALEDAARAKAFLQLHPQDGGSALYSMYEKEADAPLLTSPSFLY